MALTLISLGLVVAMELAWLVGSDSAAAIVEGISQHRSFSYVIGPMGFSCALGESVDAISRTCAAPLAAWLELFLLLVSTAAMSMLLAASREKGRDFDGILALATSVALAVALGHWRFSGLELAVGEGNELQVAREFLGFQFGEETSTLQEIAYAEFHPPDSGASSYHLYFVTPEDHLHVLSDVRRSAIVDLCGFFAARYETDCSEVGWLSTL